MSIGVAGMKAICCVRYGMGLVLVVGDGHHIKRADANDVERERVRITPFGRGSMRRPRHHDVLRTSRPALRGVGMVRYNTIPNHIVTGMYVELVRIERQ